MKKTLEEKLAEARARGGCGKAAAPAKQLMLPLWPESVHGVPNAVLRGALFTVSQERSYVKELTKVAAVDGIEISVRGERMNQHDFDLFEMLLHVQREQPLGSPVHFTAHGLLKALGRGTSGKHYQELKNDMARLASSIVYIRWTDARKGLIDKLVERVYIDEDTDHWVVEFSPQLMKLYANGHTWIDPEQRQALGNNNLAKWLHGFYGSHAKPHPMRVKTLHRLCGSTVSRLTDFRKLLRTALNRLVHVGALKSWTIDTDTDLVTVVNAPSASQRKHLVIRA